MIYPALMGTMLTDGDKQTIREIFREEVDRVENKIDKVLVIVTRSDQEHVVTKGRVNKLHVRMNRVEKKLGIKSGSSSAVFT